MAKGVLGYRNGGGVVRFLGFFKGFLGVFRGFRDFKKGFRFFLESGGGMEF